MRIAITGRSGQIVISLLEAASHRRGLDMTALGRPELDLEDPRSVHARIAAARPDLVISAAAYTAVDRAEDDAATAYAVNVTGAGAVAAAAAAAGLAVPVVHISTDYVFSGEAPQPYSESARTGPASIYGLTKLAGEHAVAEANPRHVIVRTSWVYSPFGTNFVKTMLRLAGQRDTIRVVCDQWGTPTSAPDLAEALLDMIPQLSERTFGVYHLAGTGRTNWSGLARHVFEVSRRAGGPSADVLDITSAEYPTRATRPANSSLSSAKFASAFGLSLPRWESSVETTVRRLLHQSDCNERAGPAALRA